MGITSHVSPDGNTVTIGVQGRFDFNLHQQFRTAYRERARGAGRYVVDLGSTEYMDSSALGMLLLLREHAGGDGADVRLENCRPEIRKILAIANFDKLFKVP